MENIIRIMKDLPSGSRLEVEHTRGRWSACIMFPSAPGRAAGVMFGGNYATASTAPRALAVLDAQLKTARVSLGVVGGAV